MKNIIIFASLLLFLFTSCSKENNTISHSDDKLVLRSNIPYCDDSHFITSQDDECNPCCLNFSIDLPNANFDYAFFQMFLDGDWVKVNGQQLITPSSANNNFEYCYEDEDGRDEFIIIFWDANFQPICKWEQSLFYDPCVTTGVSHLCWEDFIGFFDCATSMTVRLPNGEKDILPFTALDAAWCSANPDSPCPGECPCSAEVPVVGGYCCIANQIYAALQSTGEPFEFSKTDSDEEIGCFKGEDVLDGFFVHSNVQILSIEGSDCNGNEAERIAEFESSGHCFPPEG